MQKNITKYNGKYLACKHYHAAHTDNPTAYYFAEKDYTIITIII